jgi:hypothetical protein
MARLKSYYTTDEITNDLYTFGKEFMTRANVEYVGPYHRYSTGEVYSEFKWDPKTSISLIEYKDLTNTVVQYQRLKNFNLPTQQPRQMPCVINSNNIVRGYVTRYFINKLNQNEILEIDLIQYNNWFEGQIDKILYTAVTINWSITGTLNDIVENGITKPGVITRNRSEIAVASKRIPYISNMLNNLTEFYTDSDFVVPKDINNLES